MPILTINEREGAGSLVCCYSVGRGTCARILHAFTNAHPYR